MRQRSDEQSGQVTPQQAQHKAGHQQASPARTVPIGPRQPAAPLHHHAHQEQPDNLHHPA